MMVVSFRLIFVVLLALVIFESAAGGKASKKDKQATNEDSDEHSDANRKKETKGIRSSIFVNVCPCPILYTRNYII